jgi:hypothetical protein
MGIEPASESWELAPRAADTSQQFRSPRNEAQKRAGKQSAMDELKFCSPVTALSGLGKIRNAI